MFIIYGSCGSAEFFRAYVGGGGEMSPPAEEMTLAFDRVHCTQEDIDNGVDLWQCDTSPATSRCDPRHELAAVACRELPEESRGEPAG